MERLLSLGRHGKQTEKQEEESEQKLLNVVEVILPKLSLSWSIFRLVSRSWNDMVLRCALTSRFPQTSIICTADFTTDHGLPHYGRSFLESVRRPRIHHVSFDANLSPSFVPEDSWSNVEIINPCRGLLFLYTFGTAPGLVILNLMTNDFFNVPLQRDLYYGYGSMDRQTRLYSYALGFCPETNRYTVCRASLLPLPKLGTVVHTFTFGLSNAWRRVHKLLNVSIIIHGAYLNGYVYWIGQQVASGTIPLFTAYRQGLGNSHTLDSKLLFEASSLKLISIAAHSGCLYAVFFSTIVDPPYYIDVWVMRNSGGGEETWTKDFAINNVPELWVLPYPSQSIFQIIKVGEDGVFLCMANVNDLILYDSKTKKITEITSNLIGEIDPLTTTSTTRRIYRWGCELDFFNFSSFRNILAGRDTNPAKAKE